MVDNKEMLEFSQDVLKRLESGEEVRPQESRWRTLEKFFSDDSLVDKRRRKRVRARMQNYLTGNGQMRSVLSKKEQDGRPFRTKDLYQKRETYVHVSTGCITLREDSMEQLDREVEKITRSLHFDYDEDEAGYGSFAQKEAQEHIEEDEMPTIPQLPVPSTMVLRPNHEAFFDECIGAPVAKCSTMSLKNRDLPETKRSIRYRIKNSAGESKPSRPNKKTKSSGSRTSFLSYFLQCLRPDMPTNAL